MSPPFQDEMKPALPLPLLLTLLLLHLAIRSAAGTSSPHPAQCAVKLSALSSCLSHVAELPENTTSTPSAACCQAFAAAIDRDGGGTTCLCDLVRRPFLLGSWLDASRLVSVLSSCGNSISFEASSFAEICRDSLAKTETKFKPVSSTPTTTADDFEAGSGSVDPDRRGGAQRPKPARPSPSPEPLNPTASPPRVEINFPAPPPPAEVACPPTIEIVDIIPVDSAEGRREMLFRGAVVFLLSFFALC